MSRERNASRLGAATIMEGSWLDMMSSEINSNLLLMATPFRKKIDIFSNKRKIQLDLPS